MSPSEDYAYMARALRLAHRGLYTTDPNPRVGCVLVRDGAVVGEGFHARAGSPHAERNALRSAGVEANGATAYVTLEPCCHYGRTPPCTDALIEAGVSRVVAALLDPNPLVAGSGLERLAEAGIAVEHGPLAAQAAALNPGFLKRMRDGVPYVRCKLAMSLDGRTAMASGESQWVTGGAARRDVQRLRARSSAIVTGLGTVLADDPCLNVRLTGKDLGCAGGAMDLRQPVRVVLDPRLQMSPDARMLRLPGQTVVLTGDDNPASTAALETAGAVVASLPANGEGLDLEAVLAYLAEQEINEVMVEAGPTLAGAFLSAGLVDELVLYVAPHIMGSGARGLFHLPGLEQMRDRIQLEILQARAVGRDLRILARPDVRVEAGLN